MHFIGSKLLRNVGSNYGLIHVTKNSLLRIADSIFEENYTFGRGVIVYSEQENSAVFIKNSSFSYNYGVQGGVLFC